MNEFEDMVSSIKMKKIRVKFHKSSKGFWNEAYFRKEAQKFEPNFGMIEEEFKERQIFVKQVDLQQTDHKYILDQNRIKIYSIVLSKCRFTIDALRAAFATSNKNVLKRDVLEVLECLIPSAEDTKTLSDYILKKLGIEGVRSLEEYSGDRKEIDRQILEITNKENLCQTELYLIRLLCIKEIRDMINYHLLMMNFKGKSQFLFENLNNYYEPFIQIQMQKKFGVLLKLILRIINFINNGCPKNNDKKISERGYKKELTSYKMELDDIRIFLDCKGLTTRKNLLDFIIQLILFKDKNYLNFLRDLDFSKQEEIIITELQRDLNNLQENLTLCETKLKNLQKEGFEGVEKFCDEIFSFIKNGHSTITGLEGMLKNLQKRISEIKTFFDFDKFSPEKFLQIFNRLILQSKESISRLEGNKIIRKILNDSQISVSSTKSQNLAQKFKSKIKKMKLKKQKNAN